MDSITFNLAVHWAWAFPILSCLALLGYCIYNTFFHPLAKYPGPFLSKFTVLRATYHAWKGDTHMDAWRCHQKYGPIVRCAPDSLSFSSPNAMRDIYSINSNVTKDPRYSVLGKDKLSLVTLIDKTEHIKRRKLVNRSFNMANIKTFEPRMRVYIDRFLDMLSSLSTRTGNGTEGPGWSQPLDISDLCCFLTCDVMTDFLFGLQYDLLRDPKWQHVVHDLEATNPRLYVMMHASFLYLGRMDKWLFPRAVQGSKGFISFVNRILGDFSGEGGNHVMPLGRFKEARGKDGVLIMNDKQVFSEAITFVIAAQDTTSLTLRALLFYLSRNPSCYKKLSSEIRTTFTASEEITFDKLSSLPYLTACIQESMRMSPGIPGTKLFRHVKPGGATVDGEHIPSGANIAAGIYTVHHDENIFPNPWKFIPERWIADQNTSQEQLDERNRFWMPFSMGPRACIGRDLARAFIAVSAASIVRGFDLSAPEGVHGGGVFEVRDYIVAMGEGPVLRVRRAGV